MRENRIEAYLKTQVKAHRGVALKFVSPGRKHVPDDLCKIPGHPAFLVETKATGKKARAGQLREHDRLRAVGFLVFVADSCEKVDEAIDYVLRYDYTA